MPELPDIFTYIESLDRLLSGKRLQTILVKSPFVVRTFDPPIEDCNDQLVVSFDRMGKRICWNLDNNRHLVFHLMLTGRFHWKKPGTIPKGKNDLAAFQFEHGTMMLTEMGTRKRASIHVVDEAGLSPFQSGAVEVLECSLKEFMLAIRAENRTLKRALTNPKRVSGIGNAYSDEILLRAGLSPFIRTGQMSDEQIAHLFETVQVTMNEWIERLREQTGSKFPERVTAFRKEMLAHGKFGEPCGICKTPIQRVVYAEKNEMNYCPTCQTNGKILADRSLSRLLKNDWPKTVEEWLSEEEPDLPSS